MKYIIVFLLVLLGCGNKAEAKPRVRKLNICTYIIKGAADYWDLKDAVSLAVTKIQSIAPRLRIRRCWPDPWLYENERPELLTLIHFWDYSLLDYWFARIPTRRNRIQMIVLPPLWTERGPMYGGMSKGETGCKPHYGWFFINFEKFAPVRNAAIIGHELAHQFGASDHCDMTQVNGEYVEEKPHLMCWKYSEEMKTNPGLGYDWLAVRQIKQCLGIPNE